VNAITKTEAGALALPEAELLGVLRSSLYPGAADASIRMVLGYCKAAGLDPMQKPVHIVPMWDSKAGQLRDVVMPGVTLYRTQASRSGSLAGVSEPEFGPMATENIGGLTITYPEWCKVTVRRQLASGHVADFTATEYWLENYAIKGGKEKSIAPNAMWTKRPRGQLAKCAEAQALRKAFPELGAAPTAEEMEGKQLHPEDAPAERAMGQAERVTELPAWPDEAFERQFERWSKAVQGGLKTADEIVTLATSKGQLSAEQLDRIKGLTSATADEQPQE
jgi:phage recombination protein Bet